MGRQSGECDRGRNIRAGDKFRQLPDGDYVHCGRSDDMLKVGGIWVSPVEVESTLLTDLLSWVVPAVVFFGLWTFLVRRMSQGLGGGLMSIGKSKAKIYVEADTGVTFDDVAGVDELAEVALALEDDDAADA